MRVVLLRKTPSQTKAKRCFGGLFVITSTVERAATFCSRKCTARQHGTGSIRLDFGAEPVCTVCTVRRAHGHAVPARVPQGSGHTAHSLDGSQPTSCTVPPNSGWSAHYAWRHAPCRMRNLRVRGCGRGALPRKFHKASRLTSQLQTCTHSNSERQTSTGHPCYTVGRNIRRTRVHAFKLARWL